MDSLKDPPCSDLLIWNKTVLERGRNAIQVCSEESFELLGVLSQDLETALKIFGRRARSAAGAPYLAVQPFCRQEGVPIALGYRVTL